LSDEKSQKTPTEILTDQFYSWEKRGRGWQVWSHPVQLEPTFIPFFGHFLQPTQNKIIDDGRQPTVLSKVADTIVSFFSSENENIEQPEDQEELYPHDSAYQDLFASPGQITEFQIFIPQEYNTRIEVMEHFVRSLNHLTCPVSFEFIGNDEHIIVQFSCSAEDADQLYSVLRAYLPEITILPTSGYLERHWDETEDSNSIVIDFGLANECMLPIQSYTRFDIDPLISIITALEAISENELGVFQILFSPVLNPWAENMIRAVTDIDGKSFFGDAPELVSLTKQKISKPLFSTVIRTAVRSHDPERMWNHAKRMVSSLHHFDLQGSNHFIPLDNEDYPDEIHELDLIHRRSHRTGQFLNAEELVSIAHIPNASVRSEKLFRDVLRTKKAPAITEGHALSLGMNHYGYGYNKVTLSPEQRMKHMYIIGASGTGKSTLVSNLISQDIHNGEGIAVLDPHGDLIDEILGLVPEERLGDVIVFDPSDAEYPIGFNIFDAHTELEKNLLASDLVGIFKRLSTSWGDQMNSVLSNAILALLEHPDGGTLINLRRFLVDKDYRNNFLKKVTDSEIVFYWEKEFPLLSGKPQGPILTRLDMFLRPKIIRNMVAQRKNRIDFSKIMNEKKIFLAKLSHGLLGEENSSLLGAFLVSKFQQAAMSRQELSKDARTHFYLYIDEFQNFTTPSMESLLSGGRKYNIGLVLAHQDLQQLVSRNKNVASSVITNPYTRICFRMGEQDAKKLESGFSYFNADDLQNLSIGEALCRVEQSAFDFNLTSPLPLETSSLDAKLRRNQLIDLSRKMYGVPRQEIEAAIEKETQETFGKKIFTEEIFPKETKEIVVPKDSETEISKKRVVKTPTDQEVLDDGPLLGRGGPQHKYLQQLIKKVAEERGYRALIEHQIDNGAGHIDVALLSDKIKIACEVSITTSVDHELGNIQKCIMAGFDPVILLASETKHLRKLQSYIEPRLSETEVPKVRFFLPDDFVAFIDQHGSENPKKETIVKGYKVKVNFKALDEKDQKARRESIAKILVQSMKRMERK
jgi:type IV secretory system conjugative DNA transfer VirD4/TraG family protein/type IV secretion system coupling TraD/TrwB family protein